LRALVDTFEATFGFGDGIDGSDPELIASRGVKSGADALPAIFHAKQWGRQGAGVAEELRTIRSFEEAVRIEGREKIQNGFDAEAERPGQGGGESQRDVAADFAAVGSGAKEEILGEGKARRIGGIQRKFGERDFEVQFGVIGGGIPDLEVSSGDGSEFAELQIFVVGEGPGILEKEQAERVAGEAIVAEEALEIGLLDANLVVNGDRGAAVAGIAGRFAKAGMAGLEAALDGVDERGGRGTEIEGGNGGSVGRLEKSLVLGSGKEELGVAVGVVIEKLDAGDMAAGSELIDEGFRANEIAPELGAKMRRVESAENAVPVGVISLPSQEQVAGFVELRGVLWIGMAGRNSGDARGSA